MNFISHPVVVVKKNPLFSFVAFIAMLSFVATIFVYPYLTHAVAEELTCDDGETRTINVGVYTDATGSTFTSDASVTLSASAGNCTFVLDQDQNDSAIPLDALTIDAGVTLTHPNSTSDIYYKIDFDVAGNATVSGTINVSGKGFLGGRQGDNASDSGRGEGNVLSSDAFNGGSHGGRGGKDNTDWTGVEYDSITNPTLPGGGGGAGSSDPGDEGGNGGGVVRLSAVNIFGDGNIYANGANSVYGGGAGGSIYLNAGGGDTGSIILSAYGGSSTGAQGGGGGGRIVIVNYGLFGVGGNPPFGGISAAVAGAGAAGTKYYSASEETYGTLYINNNDTDNAYYATSLPVEVPAADAVAEFGDAFVFENVSVGNYGILNISEEIDDDDGGAVNFDRKMYITTCPADNDDRSDGEIIYNYTSAGIAGANKDYVCVAPQHVLRFETVTSTSASESVTTGEIIIETQGPTSAEITFDMVVYNVSTTALSGTDFTTSTAGASIAIGDTTTTYSFTIVDDESVESDEDVVFELANASAGSVTTTEPYFFYTIADNDMGGLTLEETGSTAVYEGGSSDTYTIVLTVLPTDDVTVELAAPGGEITLSTSSIVFTVDSWDTPQTITLTAVDDEDDEGTDVGDITHTITSDDPVYTGLDPVVLEYGVIDNDLITVTQSDGTTIVTEGTTTDTLSYVLDQEPAPDTGVLITLTPEEGLSLSTTSLTFLVGNWDTPQVVTISATDDDVITGDRDVTIAHEVDSSDGTYDNAILATTTVSILEDDEEGDGQSHNGGSARPRPVVVRTVVPPATLPSSTPVISPVPSQPHVPVTEEPVFNEPVRPQRPTQVSVMCPLEIGHSYQARNDSRVYMISRRIDGNGNLLDGCVRWHLATPLYYFSYFSSWDDIDQISEEKLFSISETNISLRVLGPRFTPYNGSVVKKVGDDRMYYILREKKYAIDDEQILSGLGLQPDWVQYMNTEVLNRFADGGNLDQGTARPEGMVVTFTSTPGQAFRVASNNGQLVGYNIGLIDKLNDQVYRRDRIPVISETEVLPTPVDDGLPIKRFLTFGSVGQDVRSLQRKLARLGYFTYESFTGRYGYETTRAVERFQRDHGIEPKGYVGPATRDLLNAL